MDHDRGMKLTITEEQATPLGAPYKGQFLVGNPVKFSSRRAPDLRAKVGLLFLSFFLAEGGGGG